MNPDDYRPLVQLALREDLGDRGDVTTSAVFSDEVSQAVLSSKDHGILAGEDVFWAVFAEVDSHVVVEFGHHDGEALEPGDKVATVHGKISSILTGERIAINFISLLSGIATSAGEFVESAACGGNTIVLDTRKTIPGYRNLSKYAVRTGGAKNHRTGLFDMVMLKDNHIDFAGSISEAVRRVRQRWSDEFRIEVECRSLAEVEEALECGVDVIMLDNMDVTLVERAVSLRDRAGGARAELEASGNMNLETVRTMSGAGVDFVSVGSLTHSVRSFDFSLKTDKPK